MLRCLLILLWGKKMGVQKVILTKFTKDMSSLFVFRILIVCVRWTRWVVVFKDTDLKSDRINGSNILELVQNIGTISSSSSSSSSSRPSTTCVTILPNALISLLSLVTILPTPPPTSSLMNPSLIPCPAS